MESLALELGVEFHTDANVEKINITAGRATGLTVNGTFHPSDIVLSGADYAHTETLLEEQSRVYSKKYWNKRVFAPSALLYYVGFDKPVENVLHHTLFFDVPFGPHAAEIYDNAAWPKKPLFYASFPSKTDEVLAPKGQEAGIFLVPIAPGLEDTEAIREEYFDILMERMKVLTGNDIKPHVIFKRSYCINDFVDDYNSFKGNAYGLANTLTQTAFLRPRIQSKKIKNLYFTGQLTVPGPGVPPSLISGKIVADKINADVADKKYERAI
jgi:phytoene desaturase